MGCWNIALRTSILLHGHFTCNNQYCNKLSVIKALPLMDNFLNFQPLIHPRQWNRTYATALRVICNEKCIVSLIASPGSFSFTKLANDPPVLIPGFFNERSYNTDLVCERFRQPIFICETFRKPNSYFSISVLLFFGNVAFANEKFLIQKSNVVRDCCFALLLCK